MFKRISMIAAAATLSLGLTACNSATFGDMGIKQMAGTGLGAALGAWGGSQVGKGDGRTAAIAVGTLFGAWAGGEVGASLDRADRLYAARAANTAMEYGSPQSWTNPQSGNQGMVAPASQVYVDPNRGRECRTYETTIVIGGKAEKGRGTACRNADGSWDMGA